MVGVTHVAKPAAQFHVGVFAYDEGGEAVFQLLHDVLQEYGLRVGGCLLGRQEGALHHRLVVEHLLEILVLLHDAPVVGILEPVAAAPLQFGVEL